MDPTDAQIACFEAGIKFGSLYHQFAGTPVRPESVDSLTDAIEAAIENQPYCEDVRVRARENALREAVRKADADYVELTGRYLDVDIGVDYDGVTVEAEMAMDGEYPLMELVDVEEPTRSR